MKKKKYKYCTNGGKWDINRTLCAWKDHNISCEGNGGCPFLEYKIKKSKKVSK